MLTSQAFAGNTLPTGGQYVAGTGNIGSIPHGLVVNQTSQTGIINWRGFSIAGGNSVLFNNGSGATLNRVTGGNLSQIDGQLSATGSVYLINPQGVVIGSGGRVITNGSFVASSRDVSNAQFMQGGTLNFDGTSAGNVSNNGSISSTNGNIILIGNAASNTGSISAPNGTASLAAGNQVLLQQSGGDANVFVAGGTGNATNSGVIQAAQAQLTAAGGNVYALAGNNGGAIRATGGETVDGEVWLTAGGTTEISGSVSANNANGTGGTVVATGSNVTLTKTATVAVSGTTGGTVLIGGEVHGGAVANANFVATPVANAQTTMIAKGARISADGTAGAGGNVVVWSNEQTDYEGAISATGAGSGNGGFAEVSSHDLLGFTGTVDLTAANGHTGMLLLDPEDVTISSSTTASDTLSGGTYTPSGSDSVINTGDLETALSTANVTVTTGSSGTQSGDITVASALSWSSAHTLTLTAANNININAAITISGTTSASGLILTATGGSLNFSSGGSVAFGGTSDTLNINGQAYTLVSDLSMLETDVAGNSSGFYALAKSINAPGTTYTTEPVTTTFTGTFEGLGNTISNLSINSTDDNVGLFAQLGSGGTIRDIGLVGGTVSLGGTTSSGNVGALVGTNLGSVVNAYASTTVNLGSGTESSSVGGLVGTNSGTITGSYTTGVVNGDGSFPQIGGLVGENYGGTIRTITDSYATGAVNGGGNTPDIGGLAGANNGTITNSYATGAVTGTGTDAAVGGLVGYNSEFSGFTGTASIAQSYATGAVSSSGNTSTIYSGAGGLVGVNDGVSGPVSIANSYSTGNVASTGSATGFVDGVGGLVGYNYNDGSTASIATSYSTGTASGGSGSNVGGIVGSNDGSISSSVWNQTTSGTTTGIGAGTNGGATGLTTSQLQDGSLPSGFSTTYWGIPIVGMNPYLNFQIPAGEIQISGTVSNSYAGTGVSGATIALLADGSSDGTTTSASNGTYKFVVPTGEDYLTYVTAGAASANAYIQAPTSAVTTANLYGGYLTVITSATKLSSISAGIANALGSNSGSNFLFTVPGGVLTPSNSDSLEIDAAGAFTVDQALSASTLILSDASAVTQSASISATDLLLKGGGSFTLTNTGNAVGTLAANSTGAIDVANDANISTGSIDGVNGITSDGTVTVTATGNLTIASSAPVTGGSNDDVALSATGNFINDDGSSAISVSGSGRWLVYSNSPTATGETFDNLNSSNTAIWNSTYSSLAPGSVAASGDRYIFAFQPTLTLTAFNTVKTYGTDATAALAYTLSATTVAQNGVSGAFLGNTLSSVYTGTPTESSSGAAATADVSGSPYTIAISQGSVASTDGYALSFVNGSLTVNPATVTYSVANASSTYGTLATPGAVTLSGVLAADSGNVSGTEGTYSGATPVTLTATTNAGSYLEEAVGLTGAKALDYTIATSGNTNGTLTINPKSITVIALGGSSNYGDNPTNPGLSANGLVGGQDVSVLTGLSNSFGVSGTSGTGNYTLNVSGTLTNGNYSVSSMQTGTWTVDPRPITVTANAESQTYGDAVPTLSYVVGGDGLVNGDTLSGLLATTGSSTANVGTYAITQGSVTNANNTNYDISYTGANLTIGTRPITVTANAESQTYGDAVPTLSYVVGGDGLVNGDTLSGLLATTGSSTANVGTYAITQGTLAPSTNYTVTAYTPGTLTIDPATLTVALTGTVEKTYDGTTTATLAPANYTLSGVLFSDAVSLNDPSAGTYAGKDAGTAISVTASGLQISGSAASNYVLASNSVSGAVGIIDPKDLAVSITANNKVYDGTTIATLSATSLSGVVGGDTVNLVVGTANFTNSNVGSGETVTASALGLSGVSAADYVVASTATTTANITLAPLTIVADNISAPSLAQAHPVATFVGLAPSDTSGVVGGLQFAFVGQAPLASYVIVPFGASAANYSISYEDGTLTLTAPSANTEIPNWALSQNFALQKTFAGFVSANVVPQAIGGDDELFVFWIGDPGTLQQLGRVQFGDYSNVTGDQDRLGL